MIKRITKASTIDLVKQIKKVEIAASVFSPQSVSAFALHKQMQNKRFKEVNPKYECVFNVLTDPKSAPNLKVEYNNGMSWSVDTGDFTCQRLRYEIFSRAQDVEVLDIIANAEKPEDL